MTCFLCGGPEYAIGCPRCDEPPFQRRCGKYLGDNDGTCPQTSCVRENGHPGLCDNTSDAPDRASPTTPEGQR